MNQKKPKSVPGFEPGLLGQNVIALQLGLFWFRPAAYLFSLGFGLFLKTCNIEHTILLHSVSNHHLPL